MVKYFINTDATFDSKLKRSCIGYIIKDEKGNIINRNRKTIKSIESQYSELEAIRHALICISPIFNKHKKDINTKVVIELSSDCKTIVEILLKSQKAIIKGIFEDRIMKDNWIDNCDNVEEQLISILRSMEKKLIIKWIPREENTEVNDYVVEGFEEWIKHAKYIDVKRYILEDLTYSSNKWKDLFNLEEESEEIRNIIKDVDKLIEKYKDQV